MKKLFFTLVTLLISLPIYAQKGGGNEIDIAIDHIEQQVDSIDNEICFKTLVDYKGYRLGSEDDINEWLAVLYYDKIHRIKKSKCIISYPEGQEFNIRYYNTNGVAFYSLYSSFSGMNNSYSVSRYLNIDKRLLYIDFLRRDDDRGGIIIEHTCRSGGYDMQLPQVDGCSYDTILDIKSLVNELKYFSKIDSLYMPKEVDSVKFIEARKGDKTFVTRNSVPLYKKKSDNMKPIMELNVGYAVEILDIKKEWCKIRYRTWEKQATGYIKSSYLAPVEIKMQCTPPQ